MRAALRHRVNDLNEVMPVTAEMDTPQLKSVGLSRKRQFIAC